MLARAWLKSAMRLEAISVAVGEEERSGVVVDGNFPMGMLTEPGSTRSWESIVVIAMFARFELVVHQRERFN